MSANALKISLFPKCSKFQLLPQMPFINHFVNNHIGAIYEIVWLIHPRFSQLYVPLEKFYGQVHPLSQGLTKAILRKLKKTPELFQIFSLENIFLLARK